MKFKYVASRPGRDDADGEDRRADTSSIHIDSIGIQRISGSAPAAPTALLVSASTPSSVSLSWHAVTNSKLYDIYRNGQLVGTSTTNSFTDANLPFGQTCHSTPSVPGAITRVRATCPPR